MVLALSEDMCAPINHVLFKLDQYLFYDIPDLICSKFWRPSYSSDRNGNEGFY